MRRRPFLSGLTAAALVGRDSAMAAQTEPAWFAPLTLTASKLPQVGVCVHPRFGAAQTIAAMRRLNLSRVRTDTPTSLATGDYFHQLADAGLACCYIVGAYGGRDEVDAHLRLLTTLERSRPGAVSAIEGPNEVNNGAQSWDGHTDPKGADMDQRSAAKAAMRYIYSSVKSNPVLKSKPVVGYTDIYPAPVARMADYANMHVYAHDEGPLDWWLSVNGLSKLKAANPGLPWYVTEWGDRLVGDKTRAVEAEHIAQGLLTQAEMGTTSHYLYALFDDENPYGLFDSDGAPRLAGRALAGLHSFMQRAASDDQAHGRPIDISDPSGRVHVLRLANATKTTLLLWTWNKPSYPIRMQWRTDRSVSIRQIQWSPAISPGVGGSFFGRSGFVDLSGQVIALELIG